MGRCDATQGLLNLDRRSESLQGTIEESDGERRRRERERG